MLRRWCVSIVAAFAGVVCLAAQSGTSELVWQPVNPSFGGNPYNASWLLSSAQSQNDLEGTQSTSASGQDDVFSDFEASLRRQILNRITNQVIEAAFGEDDIEPGHYEVGNFFIDISDSMTGVGIVITDPVSGQETVIEIPYF